ncbi:MAG: hypothetical protein AABW47_03565 [Nanoarchaeota archaeon]
MKLKKSWITPIIIIAIVSLAFFVISKNKNETPDDIAKCIGKNSILYIQLGCSACKTQENLFGESYQYLTKVDCWFERDKCTEIQKTPTWIIKGEKYEGVQSIEKLKELTNC